MMSHEQRGGHVLRRAAGALVLAACCTATWVERAWAIGSCSTSVCVGAGSSCAIDSGSNVVLSDGCVLDLSSKDVTVTKRTKIVPGASGYSYTVSANSLILYGTLTINHGTLSVSTTGEFRADSGNNSPAHVDVDTEGTLSIVAGGRIAFFGGEIDADGPPSGGDGGTIKFRAGTYVQSSADIHADGHNGGNGGRIEVIAAGDVTVSGSEFDADGVGPTNGSVPADGGAIYVKAGEDVVVASSVSAKGDQGGDGGSIELIAVGSGNLSGNLTANGVGGTSVTADGGRITIDVGSATGIVGNWKAIGNYDGDGGIVEMTSRTGAIGFSSSGSYAIDVSSASGGGSGGSVLIASAGDLSLGYQIKANAGGAGSVGGYIALDGGGTGTITISKLLEARSTTSTGERDGAIDVSGCNVAIAGGTLKTRTQVGGGSNTVTYGGTFSVTDGSLMSDADGNTVVCGCPDANADGACDSTSCASSPSYTNATRTPTEVTVPSPVTCN